MHARHSVWMPGSLARTLAALALLAMVTGALTHSAAFAASPASQTVDLPAGITMEMLGSHEFSIPDDRFDLVLERVPLDPLETLNGRDPDESGGGLGSATTPAQLAGAHLLFAEAGAFVVASASAERTLRAGDSTFEPPLPADEARVDEQGNPLVSYDLRNETTACASLMRLSVWVLPGQLGGVPQAPSGPQRGCGSYELLFHDLAQFPLPEPPPPQTPVQMFLARLVWSDDPWIASLPPLAYDGPVGFLVESGELTIEQGDPNAAGMAAHFAPGGSIRIDAGVVFRAWATPGSRVLVMGVAPAAGGWTLLPPRPAESDPATTTFAPGSTVVVIDDRVRLRATPSTAGGIAAVLERGARLTVIGAPETRDGFTWYPVTDETGRAGYVAGDFLAAS